MIDLSTLHHKNVFASGAIALAIVGIGVYQTYGSHFSSPTFAKNTTITEHGVSSSTDSDITTRDSDRDGLRDWAETLYGSNPSRDDTDGDGTTDGDEVALGRNPVVANLARDGDTPNDMLATIQDPNFATSSSDIAGERKAFFAKFLAQAGTEIRETTYRDLLKRFDPELVTPRNQYVDLTVSSDNSPEALRIYGNSFGLFIKRYTVRTHRTEEEILEEAMKIQSKTLITELQLPGITYKNFSADLKALKTPSMLAKSHLKIVNGYEQMSRGLFVMQALFTDPINGAGGYEAYLKGRADVTLGYAEVVGMFAQHGISFASDEPGYPFYANIVAARAQEATL